MKKYVNLSIIFSLLFSLSSSCERTEQKVVEEPQVDSTTLVLDTLPKLSNDSFFLEGRFYDLKNHAVLASVAYRWIQDTSTIYKSDESGIIERVLKLDDYYFMVADETFNITEARGGDTLKLSWQLPVYEVKGRIMEVDGTPLKCMPLHVHCQEKRKLRIWRRKETYDRDELIYTDSLGYYRTYVPQNTESVTLRSCGFLVGKISRKEMMNYPTQNFLFEPFSIVNVWGDYVPPYTHQLMIPSTNDTINMEDRTAFFACDSLLESLPSVNWIASSRYGKTRKNIKKRNAVFQRTAFKITVKYVE